MIDSQELIIKYVTLPLYNIRMLPQFHQTRFNHPIAPLVDLNSGFTTVFTLNLYQTAISYTESINSNNNINIMLHENS